MIRRCCVCRKVWDEARGWVFSDEPEGRNDSHGLCDEHYMIEMRRIRPTWSDEQILTRRARVAAGINRKAEVA